MNTNYPKQLQELLKQYEKLNPLTKTKAQVLPNNNKIKDVIHYCQAIFFPEFFGNTSNGVEEFTATKLEAIEKKLTKEIEITLRHFGDNIRKPKDKATLIVECFIDELPNIHKKLFKDKEAFFEGDPAAENDAQIILSYPGFFAIMVYRIAHLLHKLGVPMIPRIMSEYAHSVTGVDIHPGAEIGEYFFIDHGTGVVIGETTIIGDHVRIYQGVTLGGLTIIDREHSIHVKRHPTIGNNVTIYANATILGGESVIGDNCIIGGGAFVTSSIEKNTIVSMNITKDNLKTRPRKSI